jgi:hypothetical protein
MSEKKAGKRYVKAPGEDVGLRGMWGSETCGAKGSGAL